MKLTPEQTTVGRGQCYVEWRRRENEVALVFCLPDAYACAVQYESLLTALRNGAAAVTVEVESKNVA